MKTTKINILCVLMAALLLILPTAVYADGTTTLTATVPAATYTLNIPADMEIPYGATEPSIGTLSVTDCAGFVSGKRIQVTVSFDAFSCADTTTTIPYRLEDSRTDAHFDSGNQQVFLPSADENYTHYAPETTLRCVIQPDSWTQALPGEYTSTITFTSKVVVEE